MTYKDAAQIIQKHMKIHFGIGDSIIPIEEYPHLDQITEALQMAVELLKERAAIDDCLTVLQKGSQIWYVDFETGEIEEGEVFSVSYKDGHIDSFSVEFKEIGDFDEFYGSAIGDNFFLSRNMAEQALVNGHGIKAGD